MSEMRDLFQIPVEGLISFNYVSSKTYTHKNITPVSSASFTNISCSRMHIILFKPLLLDKAKHRLKKYQKWVIYFSFL